MKSPPPRPRARQFITSQGALFAVSALAIGFAAVNTGNNLSYLFFAVMLSFLFLGALIATPGMKKISVERAIPRHIHAGEPFAVTLALWRPRAWLPVYSIRAVDLFENDAVAGACYFLRVSPREKTESSYVLQINRRGIYRLSAARLVTTYPFGFFRRTVTAPVVSEVLIYPQTLPVAEWAAYSPVALGEQKAPRKGMGSDLYGLRDYHTGDSARLIHWKVSARTRKLVAREFESEEKKRVTLLLDNGVARPDDDNLRKMFERAVVAAASLATTYLELGYQAELVTRTGRVPMGMGKSHQLRILRSLARVELMEYTGAPLWLPPPSTEETHIAIQYRRDVRRARTPNVTELPIWSTPPFAQLKVTKDHD